MHDDLTLRAARPDDYARICSALNSWWADGRQMSALLQPLFLENFSGTSLVYETVRGDVAAFLVGFVSGDDPRTAYVHFIGVAPDLRGRGIASALYDNFDRVVSKRGVERVRCVTSVVNTGSVDFHTAIGFSVDGHVASPDVDGGKYVQMSRVVKAPESPSVMVKQWPPPADVKLSGEYVQVQPTAVSDARGMFDALADERVWEHLTVPRPLTPGDMELQIRDALRQRFPWTVRLVRPYAGSTSGDVVGWTSYLEVSEADARLEIGSTAYAPSVWRSAVNTETKLLLLGYAFEELGFGRVQLKTDIRNVRSQQGIEGIGAQREGVLRWYQRRADATLRDTVVYSITSAEWPTVRDQLRSRLARN